MDLERYRAAWARNAIAKQQLDDQEKIVQQDEGTVKNDQGTVEYDKRPTRLLPHRGAHHRPRRPAAGRSRQRRHLGRHHHAGRDYADCSPSP
jgi:hypothetical protein